MDKSFSASKRDGWEASPESLRGALLTLLVGSLALVIALRWFAPDQHWRTLAPVSSALLACVAWWLLARKGVLAAKRVLGLGGLAVSILACLFNGGAQAPVVIGFPVLLMMIGWLFSKKAAVCAAALTLVALWAMVAGTHFGWMPPPPESTPGMYVLVQTMVLVLTVYMTLFMVTSYRAQVRHISQTADALARTTQELQASQMRLQTVIDVSGTLFWEHELTSDTLTYDHTKLQQLGVNLDHPPSNMQEFLACLHPDDRQRFLDVFHGTVQQALPALDHDYRVQDNHGGWVWVHMRGAVIRRGADQRPTVLGGGIVNIQARKTAEAALQASEQKAHDLAQMLRSLCDNVPDLIWAKDLDNRYLFTNQAMCSQLLQAKHTDEPVGKDYVYFARRERDNHPKNPHWHDFAEAGATQADAEHQLPASARQWEASGNVKGQLLVLDVRQAPFVNAQGRTVGVVGTGRDVTADKAAQDRLRLLALALECSSEALLITDENHRVVEVNPAFTRLTGYSRTEILGQKPSLLRSGRHDADFYRDMWNALETKGAWQGEIWNRRKNGAIFVEWMSINTLYAADGKPYRYVALFSDMTENKQKEEMLWQQANFDPLTLLPNRRLFEDRLAVAIKTQRRHGQHVALLFMDLDHFKEVNDTLGHEAGDKLLVQAGTRLLSCVRSTDTVARLGGDEFTVILSELDHAAAAEKVAQNIVSAMGKPFDLDGHPAQLSVSIGIALCPQDADNLTDLLQLADQAMYVAKRAGRNGYRFCHRPPPTDGTSFQPVSAAPPP